MTADTNTVQIVTLICGALTTIAMAYIGLKTRQNSTKTDDLTDQVAEVKDVADKTHEATNSHALVLSGQYAQLAKRMAVSSGAPEDHAIAESAQALYDASFAANEAAKAQAVKVAEAQGNTPVANPTPGVHIGP